MKVIKSILFLLLVTVSLAVSAQKVTVKKDKVLFDEVEIANLKKIGNDIVVFSSLLNENTIITEFKMKKINDDITKKWIIVSDKSKTRSSEIEMEFLSVTLNYKKAIAELLAKKYNLITKYGIENIDNFFSIKRPDLTSRYDKLVSEQDSISEKINSIDINIDKGNKRIFQGKVYYTRDREVYKNMIGTYTLVANSIRGTVFNIFDLDNNKVAVAEINHLKEVLVTIPFRAENFGFNSKTSFSYNSIDFYEKDIISEIVQHLYSKGVYLTHQINQDLEQSAIENYKILQKQYSLAKENSANFYYTKGYVEDEKEGKMEGEIEYIVEKLEIERSNIIDLNEDNLGRNISLKYKNDKGKTRYKNFKSKDGTLFCLAQNNKELCFRGLRTLGKGLDLATGAISTLSFDTSYFYIIVEENDFFSIYKEYNTDENEFIIKIKPQDKGYKFNTINEEKNIEKLSEYLEGIVDISKLEGLNYTSLDDIKKLADIYKSKIR